MPEGRCQKDEKEKEYSQRQYVPIYRKRKVVMSTTNRRFATVSYHHRHLTYSLVKHILELSVQRGITFSHTGFNPACTL
jgi:hypothetical protein